MFIFLWFSLVELAEELEELKKEFELLLEGEGIFKIVRGDAFKLEQCISHNNGYAFIIKPVRAFERRDQ